MSTSGKNSPSSSTNNPINLSTKSPTPENSLPRYYIKEFWGRARSDVWDYFGFWADQGGNYLDRKSCVCRLCQSSVRYNGNTSALRVHLDAHHRTGPVISPVKRTSPLLCSSSTVLKDSHWIVPVISHRAAMQNERPRSADTNSEISFRIQQVVGSSDSYSRPELVEGLSVSRAASITNAIIDYVLLDRQPLTTVEMTGFQNLIKSLEPKYHMPSRSLLLANILAHKYNDVTESLLVELSEAPQHTITESSWADQEGRSYMVTTAHYLTPKFIPKSTIIGFHHLDPPERQADHIKSILMCLQSTWKLMDPVAVLRDAMSMVVKPSKWMILPCFNAAVNAAVKSAFELPEIAALLNAVKDLVGHFKRRLNSLNLVQQHWNQPGWDKAVLSPESHPQWVVGLAILQQVLLSLPTIDEVLGEYYDVAPLTTSQAILIQGLVDILMPFKTACDMLAQEDFPCISLVLPTLFKLSQVALNIGTTDHELIAHVKSAISTSLEHIYGDADTQNFLALASVMDPRLRSLDWMDEAQQNRVYYVLKETALNIHRRQSKTVLGKSVSPSPSGRKSVTIREEPSSSSSALPQFDRSSPSNNAIGTVVIKKEPVESLSEEVYDGDVTIVSHSKRQCLDLSENQIPSPNGSTTPKPGVGVTIKTESGMLTFLEDVVKLRAPRTYRSQLSLSAQAQAEIDRYLAEENVNGTPLEWWASQTEGYPLLSNVARGILCVPAISSVVSEAEDAMDHKGLDQWLSQLSKNVPIETAEKLALLHLHLHNKQHESAKY